MNFRLRIKELRIFLMKKFDFPASIVGWHPVYAQGKEDVILLRLFGEKHRGYFVDVGANNGVFISNTYTLYRQGWRGICIEPNPEAFAKLVKVRERDICLKVAVGSEPGVLQLSWQEGISEGSVLGDPTLRNTMKTQVEVQRLDQLLRTHGAPTDFDLLSIDVEGRELDVLEGMDWKTYRPHLILLEYNQGGDVNADAVELVLQRGYRPIFINRWNVIFSSQWERDILRVHKGQTWFQFDRGGI